MGDSQWIDHTATATAVDERGRGIATPSCPSRFKAPKSNVGLDLGAFSFHLITDYRATKGLSISSIPVQKSVTAHKLCNLSTLFLCLACFVEAGALKPTVVLNSEAVLQIKVMRIRTNVVFPNSDSPVALMIDGGRSAKHRIKKEVGCSRSFQ